MSERGRLNLDRMAIEEAGPNPERIAAAIHDQLALPHGPMPIFDIAKALDIFEIREAPLKTFEAALLAPRERGEGVILVNRYTDRHPEFPLLACRRDAPSPRLPAPQGADRLSNHEESDWRDWLRRPPDGDLVVQTLHQQQGFAITLLMIDQPERDDGA